MDWESLFGLTGLYVLGLLILFHQFIMTKRIIHLTSTIKDILTERRSVIQKRAQEKFEESPEEE